GSNRLPRASIADLSNPELPPSAAELIDGLLVRAPDARIESAEAVRTLATGTLNALSTRELDHIYPTVEVDPLEDSISETTSPLVDAMDSAVTSGSPDDAPTPLAMKTFDEGEGTPLMGTSITSLAEGHAVAEALNSVDPVEAWRAVVGDAPRRAVSRARRVHTDFDVFAPMFGRQAMLNRASDRLQTAVQSAQPTLLFIVGPGGIGKTRLCAELVARLDRTPRPPHVYSARAEERRHRVPFAFVRRMMLAFAGVVPDDNPRLRSAKILGLLPGAQDVQRLLVESKGRLGGSVRDMASAELDRATVAAFIAEALGLSYPDVPVVVGARSEPAHIGRLMVEALNVLLRSRAEDGGLVVVVDDMEWLDYGSALVLRALLEAKHALPIAVVGFGSPILLDPDGRSDWPLVDLNTAIEAVSRIGPLSPEDARLYLEALLPAAATDEDADRIVNKAGGNVLLLEQLTLAMVETDQWRPQGERMHWFGADDTVHSTVAAAVNARLIVCSPVAQRVIMAAAVFGPVFWSYGVAVLSQVPEAEVIRELRFLTERRWVQPRRVSRYSGTLEFEFVHGALHAVALSRLKRARRETFEARAADILVQLGEREAAVLAHHRAAAGQPVAQTYLAAAERALRLGDPSTSGELADDGLAAVGGRREPFQALLLTVHERIAISNADWDLGTGALDMLETQALTAQAHFDLAARRFRLALRTGRLTEAHKIARQAGDLVKKNALTTDVQARARLYRGEVAERKGEHRVAHRLYTAAHRGLEGSEPHADLVRTLAGLATGALLSAEYATAENRFRTALVHARAHNWAALAVAAQTGLVQVTRQTADLRRARGYASELERIDLTQNRARRILLIR
ncbi:MAG: AAA family ATPase, partial [Myxococcota bacterium]